MALSDSQERLKAHLSTFNTYDLQRLRDCFEYEYQVEPENRERIQEILDFIGDALKVKLQS